ncbi:MAG: 4Fe-4S binding protein [Methanobrevibacter sp.]|uniref:4Fe-4S binding protein n=1 Tax=Methanobrevibacter sp. TaxID=66852 RepID=UPI0026DEA27C|nr:4Fe-4S binding protein [Methanobrevibacter sp.]MDO5849120.1 4Fe-4S binding protein [Methanobrevibacter sp.]
MKKISFAEISIFIVNRIFNWRFRIARLTKQSKIMNKIIKKLLFEDDEIVFVPNTIEVNKKIESSGSEFLPTGVLKEVIKKTDDIVIMDSCLCRSSSGCEDYPQDLGCIFLGPTTKKIPRAICHEATVEEALEHVDEADAAGLTHMIGKNKIDSVWMNVGPRDGLLTICHCCPCCCLWKVIPDLNDEITDKIEPLEGVSINFDEDKCINCGACLKDTCMADAISLKDGRIVIDKDLCVGCGLCANKCKPKAITISFTDESVKSVADRMYSLIKY